MQGLVERRYRTHLIRGKCSGWILGGLVEHTKIIFPQIARVQGNLAELRNNFVRSFLAKNGPVQLLSHQAILFPIVLGKPLGILEVAENLLPESSQFTC